MGSPRAISVLGMVAFLAPARCSTAADTFADRLMEHVKFLASEELHGRFAGTPDESRAAEYIAARLDEASVKPPPGGARYQVFELGSGKAAVQSRNVLGWIPGVSADLAGEVIVLGAHYDHLGPRLQGHFPGAEDNASGVAVVLEVARLLQGRGGSFARSVLVAFFGAEEPGLAGSRAFVLQGPVPIEEIAAMVNVDMIGRPLADQKALEPLKKLLRVDSLGSIGVVGARGRPFFLEVVEASCKSVSLECWGTRDIPIVTPIVEAMTKNRGDNAPFEEAGVPALFFGSGESDDYHKPTDTVDKLRPELMARRADAIRATVVALATAPAGRIPPQDNARAPGGSTRTKSLEITQGDLTVRLLDNAESPKVLSGVDALFHRVASPAFDAFDPDGAGASAGLNFEHITSGHRDAANKFAPRLGRCTLHALEGGRAAMLVRRREDCPWDVSSTLRYELVPPNAVDFEFRCTPHDAMRFGKRGHALFFFADYMNDVEDSALHFLGVEKDGDAEHWIAADAPPGHKDWNQGGTYRHRDATPLEYDDGHGFAINSWSYDFPRFTRPFYFGRAANGMVLELMFDRASSPEDEVRFSLFKFKLPKRPRPAWDFQYVVRKVQAGRTYGFRGRLVWKKWVSEEDCLAEYESWNKTVDRKGGPR